MNNSFFLNQPAWKIFIIVIIPFIVGMWVASLIGNIEIAQISFLFIKFVQLIWVYSVCNYITKKYSSHVNVPIIRLNVSLIAVFIGFILSILYIFPIEISRFMGLITLFLSIYCAYFTARLVVMVEMKRKVTINEYLSTAIIIAFFWLFGIWFIQPRINQIYKAK